MALPATAIAATVVKIARAAGKSPAQVALNWSASSGTVTAYHVERSTDGVNFGEIATTANTTYNDNAVSRSDRLA